MPRFRRLIDGARNSVLLEYLSQRRGETVLTTQEARQALELLLDAAYQDTGGSGRCARFLLSLWDGSTYRIDLQNVMYIDNLHFEAMVQLWRYIYYRARQLDGLVTRERMAPIIDRWG